MQRFKNRGKDIVVSIREFFWKQGQNKKQERWITIRTGNYIFIGKAYRKSFMFSNVICHHQMVPWIYTKISIYKTRPNLKKKDKKGIIIPIRNKFLFEFYCKQAQNAIQLSIF